MWNRLRRWLDDLVSPDPIARQTARLLEVMLIGSIVAATLALLLMLMFAPRSLFGMMGIFSAGIAVAIAIGALLALRRGLVRLAAWVMAIGLLIAIEMTRCTSLRRPHGRDALASLDPEHGAPHQ